MVSLLLSCMHYRGFLTKVDTKCTKQIQLLFDSIDINGDGHLTVNELTVFARDLGYILRNIILAFIIVLILYNS